MGAAVALMENPAFFGIYIVPEGEHFALSLEPTRVHRNWGKLKASVREVYQSLKKDRFNGQLIVKTTHGFGKRNVIHFTNGKPLLVEAAWDSLVPDDRALKKGQDIQKRAKAAGDLKKGDLVHLYARAGGWGGIRVLKPDGSQGGTLRTAEVLYVGHAAGEVKIALHPLQRGAKVRHYTLPADRLVRAGSGVPGAWQGWERGGGRTPRTPMTPPPRQRRPRAWLDPARLGPPRGRAPTPGSWASPGRRRTSRKAPKPKARVGKWAGKNVVITGTMQAKRAELDKILRSKGATPQGSVQASTDMLIVGFQPGRSKLDRAAELGIPIVLSETLTRSLGAAFGPWAEAEPPKRKKRATSRKPPSKTKARHIAEGRRAEAKRKTSKKAPAKKKAPARKTSKKAPAKRAPAKKKAVAKGPLKTFYWTRSNGSYGSVRAASVADARKKKPGAKIHTRPPYGWM